MYRSKGFIYPAVLFVSALVPLIVNFTAAQYISRACLKRKQKRFTQEKICFRMAHFFQFGMFLSSWKGQKGSQQFTYGQVSYHIHNTSIKEQKQISLKAITESGAERTAQLVFDQKQKKLPRWTE